MGEVEQPVEFGHESNDPVDLVVALAAKDSGAHTAAMASLARMLADPDMSRALHEAPTPEALHAVLVGQDRQGQAEEGGQRQARAARGGAGPHKILTARPRRPPSSPHARSREHSAMWACR
ncbi:PTS sugar transporter subunit IIA [Streptomyces sp. 21So2-11]|uniref:PTS sugar transporter subunit IIA n=1 Tax=Streptomyces sp. 21So2-11 TaxID=3144408 RepID=UPI003218E838